MDASCLRRSYDKQSGTADSALVLADSGMAAGALDSNQLLNLGWRGRERAREAGTEGWTEREIEAGMKV